MKKKKNKVKEYLPLYLINVFLVIIQASFDENKNLKLSSPAHGLAKIPFEKLQSQF